MGFGASEGRVSGIWGIYGTIGCSRWTRDTCAVSNCMSAVSREPRWLGANVGVHKAEIVTCSSRAACNEPKMDDGRILRLYHACRLQRRPMGVYSMAPRFPWCFWWRRSWLGRGRLAAARSLASPRLCSDRGPRLGSRFCVIQAIPSAMPGDGRVIHRG